MSNLKTNKVRVGGIDYEIEDTKAQEILQILTGDTEESIDGKINLIKEEFISSESSDDIVEDIADNLASDALRKSAQILTNEEKQQVRINLGIDEVINEAITNVLNTEV